MCCVVKVKLFKQNTKIGYITMFNRKCSVYCYFWLQAKSGLKQGMLCPWLLENIKEVIMGTKWTELY